MPRDDLAQVALVGRSNVGKSSLINALVRARVARTSAAPGKTRLANVYRIRRGGNPPFHLVDLPGYGFARALRQAQGTAAPTFDDIARAVFDRRPAALLLVDARHPGLTNDLASWTWVRAAACEAAIVATKIDKLARGERIRAMRELESVFQVPVLPCSAVTGEGLDDLWKLIDRLLTSSSNHPRPRSLPPKATAQPAARHRFRRPKS